jgi:hypothetical protein
LADDAQRYVARIRQHAAETQTQLPEESERWLNWVEAYATVFDPTTAPPKSPGLVEPDHPSNKPDR